MILPHVTFRAFSDHPGRIFMHRGEIQRHFEDEGPERTQDLLAKVAISEFGVPQAEAKTFAAKTMADRSAVQASATATAALPAQLAAATAEIGRLKAENQSLKTENATASQSLQAAAESIRQLRADVTRENALNASPTLVPSPSIPRPVAHPTPADGTSDG